MTRPEVRLRLDDALVERRLVDTRSRARAVILAGQVRVNNVPVDKAGALTTKLDDISLTVSPRFVSRGGEKLDHALNVFGIDVAGQTTADVGASTGGFTDCVLQRGARRVFAIDVGYGQLADRIRCDSRVEVMDRTNVRYIGQLPERVSFVSIDVSFISLKLVLPVVSGWLDRTGICVPLVKPQFEAGRADVGKGGVVREASVRKRVLIDVFDAADDAGLAIQGLTTSPLRGPAGNIEYLMYLVRGGRSVSRTALLASLANDSD